MPTQLTDNGKALTQALRLPRTLLGRMLAVSLLLHAALFAAFLINTHKTGKGQSIPFIDLTMPWNAPSQPTATTAPSNITENREPAQTAKVKEAAEPKNSGETTRNEPADARSERMQSSSLGFSMSLGYFRGMGEGETLRPEIREYYFRMLQRINESWWMAAAGNTAGAKQEAVLNLTIGRNGDIVDKQLIQSSGSVEYDRTIMRALEVASPLPKLPDDYDGDFFRAPLRLSPPLSLLTKAK